MDLLIFSHRLSLAMAYARVYYNIIFHAYNSQVNFEMLNVCIDGRIDHEVISHCAYDRKRRSKCCGLKQEQNKTVISLFFRAFPYSIGRDQS